MRAQCYAAFSALCSTLAIAPMRVSTYHVQFLSVCLVGGFFLGTAPLSLAALGMIETADCTVAERCPATVTDPIDIFPLSDDLQKLIATAFRHPFARSNSLGVTSYNLRLSNVTASYPQAVVATGITWPPRISTGMATSALQPASDPTLSVYYPYSTLYGVEVTIGDVSTQFVVDTGASNSVLSEGIAETMALPSMPVPAERVESFVVGEHCPANNLSLYRLPPITVDRARVEGISALGLPFSTNPTRTSGVLGMDFLSEFDVILDSDAQQMHLLSPSEPDLNAIQLSGQIGLMTAEVMVNDDGPFPFMLDTGASLTVLAKDFVARMDLDLSQAHPIDVIGFCGTEAGQYLQLSHIALGHHSVRDLDVIILDSPVLKALNVDGILGQNFLSRYRQHWRFGEPDAEGFPRDGSLDLHPIQRSLQESY